MNREQSPQLRSFLPVKDWLIVGVEAGAIGAVALVAQNLGLTETYTNLWLSFTQAGVIADNLMGLFKDIFTDPEKLKPALMFAGFTAGVVTDFVYSLYTLGLLKGKIRLSGTNTFTVDEDGVRVRDRNCVDARIDQAEQEKVEPGAGQMGGAFIMNQAMAMVIDNLGDGPASDFYPVIIWAVPCQPPCYRLFIL